MGKVHLLINEKSVLRVKPTPLFLVLAPTIVVLCAVGAMMFPALKKMILAILHSPALP